MPKIYLAITNWEFLFVVALLGKFSELFYFIITLETTSFYLPGTPLHQQAILTIGATQKLQDYNVYVYVLMHTA
jgi:hypothetical protein